MTDDELIDSLERCALSAEQFGHRQHVHAAWTYLGRLPLGLAVERFSESLRRFAAHIGKPQLFHATITWAFFVLINERRAQRPDASWDEFSAAFPELFDRQRPILRRHYSQELLDSSRARALFVLPDRAPLDELARPT